MNFRFFHTFCVLRHLSDVKTDSYGLELDKKVKININEHQSSASGPLTPFQAYSVEDFA